MKTVSARIKELIKEGKSKDKIIKIVKEEIANNQVKPVRTPVEMYYSDIMSKIRRNVITNIKTSETDADAGETDADTRENNINS